ncbi:MAG: hypothetical protein H6738_05700 [Alphaproteobacteria bacterium]|nr:hypothetical protein [Alphaproteobacteria bacterium]MCB9696263.1 hypothetical protein [Alphaproteobacteria bacterium]
MTVRYDREPGEPLIELLEDGAFLAPLRRPWSVAGVPLDLQFRERDEVHLYCGLTRLVTARRGRGGIRLTASPTYTRQACAHGLFRTWVVDERGFDDALRTYLSGVVVDARWVKKEGLVQASWMALQEPWVTLDREAVLGRSSGEARERALDVDAVRAAHAAVDALSVERGWKRPPAPKGANELDQLAIDDAGRLVLVELKDARSSEVVTAPLQALRYAWEWHEALDAVLPSLRALAAARRRLHLMPQGTPELTGALRAVIAWGEGSPSAEVLRRSLAVKQVVDGHLPPGIGEVEVWSLAGGSRAARLA